MAHSMRLYARTQEMIIRLFDLVILKTKKVCIKMLRKIGLCCFFIAAKVGLLA